MFHIAPTASRPVNIVELKMDGFCWPTKLQMIEFYWYFMDRSLIWELLVPWWTYTTERKGRWIIEGNWCTFCIPCRWAAFFWRWFIVSIMFKTLAGSKDQISTQSHPTAKINSTLWSCMEKLNFSICEIGYIC